VFDRNLVFNEIFEKKNPTGTYTPAGCEAENGFTKNF